MKNKNTIKAVIFDMDGLMLDSQHIATKAWKKAVSSHGYTLTDEVNHLLVGRNRTDTERIILSIFGPEFPLGSIRENARQWFYKYVGNDGIPLKPGLIELLDFLDEKKIPTAVGTSTNRESCMAHLDKHNLVERFKTIVCGDEVALGKPEPDIFLKASKELHIAPEFCIVLEDSYPGIQAAHKAGMIPIMVPDILEPTDEIRSLTHRVVPSLNEAKLEIEELLSS